MKLGVAPSLLFALSATWWEDGTWPKVIKGLQSCKNDHLTGLPSFAQGRGCVARSFTCLGNCPRNWSSSELLSTLAKLFVYGCDKFSICKKMCCQLFLVISFSFSLQVKGLCLFIFPWKFWTVLCFMWGSVNGLLVTFSKQIWKHLKSGSKPQG